MKKLAFVVVAGSAVAAFAEDPPAEQPAQQQQQQPELEKEILVVAARREEPAESATAAVTRFDEDDFERRRPFSVSDMIREVPGAYVSPDGPPGQFTRVFLRGAASNQTLVLVDGIPQNDATAGGLYDFNDLGMTGVESVEVLRGSYSVLYGSEAIGGVVNVTTRRGRGRPSGYVTATYGSFATRREEAGVSFGDRKVDVAFAIGDSATDGEHDREEFRSHDAVGRLGVQILDTLRFDGSLRAARSRVQSPYDFATSGVLPEDDNIERTRETISGGGTLTWDAAEWLTVRGTASALDVDSTFVNESDSSTDSRDELDSSNDSTDLRGRLEATATLLGRRQEGRRGSFGLDLTAGGEYLDQHTVSASSFPNFGAPGVSASRSSDTTRTKSVFAQVELRAPTNVPAKGEARSSVITNAGLTAGVRHDDHSVFGGETSPYVGARADFWETTLRSSWGEGFRAPKPSELFDPFVGDPDLGPETSKSFDVGLSRSFFDGTVTAGITWFKLRVDDLIAFDNSTFHLANFSHTQTTGFEYEAAADLGEGWFVRGSLTHQNPRDLDTGDPLANRARTFGSAGVEWRCGEWRVAVDGFFSGSNPGQGGEFTSPDSDARANPGRRNLVDVSARWQATDGLAVFGGIRNLLDDDWVATPNSPAGPGIGVYVGAQLDF